MAFLSKVWKSIFARKLGGDIQQELETHLHLLEEQHHASGMNQRVLLQTRGG